MSGAGGSKSKTELKDLSPEQQAVVNSWGKGLAVMAGAGSGKTTTLVIKCLELIQRNPKARFAAVSFTEKSASDLRAKLAERLALLPESIVPRDGGPLRGHWVMTIHGLCGAIIREFPRQAGFDGEESVLSEPEAQLLWERAIEAIWFEELRPEVDAALTALLSRESRDGVIGLLRRVRELASFGALDSLTRSEDSTAQALGALAAFVLDRYERQKRRRGAVDFGDLERGADRAMAYPEVQKSFRERFDLVLVDEFQDTNPLQAGIVRRFCREDGSNLCVVGDPKQSIYRFRDADVSVFEDFCSQLSERHSLTWNFRSRPGIIDYTNSLCERAFQGAAMKYEPLVPKRQAGEESAVLRLELRGPDELGAWIRAEMDRGVALSDMALLLRKIRGNERWLKALTSVGIPIAVGSGGLFWEDPRVREMTAFLRWWDNPGNTLSGAIFLRAPWVAVPDAEIDEWVRRDPTFAAPFFESQHPIALRLREYRGKIVRPAELLLALLVDEKVEDELGPPLLGLWHRAEELSTRGLDFHSVVTEFQRCVEEGRRERDVPPPRNQGQLSVLTLHASKGLEFPHVILVDLGVKGRAQDMPLLFWDRAKGAFLGMRTVDGDRDKDHPIEQAWREDEKKKALDESKRLFYVALTRARERLILACPDLPEPKATKTPKKEPVDPDSVFAQDYWRGWVDRAPMEIPAIRPQPAAMGAGVADAIGVSAQADGATTAPIGAAPSAPPSALRRSPLRPRERRPRHSVTEWNMLSRCPRSYEWTYIRPRAVAPGEAEIGLFTGEAVARASEQEVSQKELGTRVHGCLERGDFDGLRALEAEVGSDRFSAENVISWAMSSDWMSPGVGEREVWPELAFEVPVAGEVLVGSMDRVVRTDRFRIIDFKVTEKPKSVEGLLEAYRTQIELYGFALRALDPEATPDRTEALLVNISPKTIQAVPVPIGALPVEALAADAAEIVAGAPGRATPGPLCRFCEFRGICPEGSHSLHV